MFSVSATGSGPLTYQWYHNNLPVSGGTGSSLALGSAIYADHGAYHVSVTDSTGTQVSAVGFLNVQLYPSCIRSWGDNSKGQGTVPNGLNGLVALSAQRYHSLALNSDGTVFAWGNNGDGQCMVPVGVGGVVAIAAGGGHSVALKTDGTIIVWGDNHYNQRTVPAGLSGVVAVAGGMNHSLALKSDGTVVAWGDNSYGQCTVPAGLGGVVAIVAKWNYSLALKSDGTVVAWGENSYGQSTVPTGLSGVVAIAAGYSFSLGLKADGTVIAWGNNSSGQSAVPSGLSGVVAIAAGDSHSLALKSDGTVVAWGDNSLGECSLPTGLTGVVAISAAGYYNLALNPLVPANILKDPVSQSAVEGQSITQSVTATGDELSYQWKKDGANIAGATKSSLTLSPFASSDAGTYTVVVGNASGKLASNPARVNLIGPTFPLQPVQSAQRVTPGTEVAFSVTASGSGPLTYQWLHNGLPITGGTNSALVIGHAGYSEGGAYQVIVSDSTGTATSTAAFLNVWEPLNRVQAWGVNSYCNSNHPIDIPSGLSGVVAIAAGDSHCLGLKSDGTVAAWGNNYYGQSTVPLGLSGVVAISAGGDYSLALKSGGNVIAWGYNPDGRGTVPEGLGGVVAIAAGAAHSLALKSDGTVIAWGDNSNGKCTVPTGLTSVIAVSAGCAHSLALKSDGTVVAWGNNYYGQSSVPLGLSGVVAISAGTYYSLALKSDGAVVAWGDNSYGQCSVSGLAGVVAINAGGSHSLALKSDGNVEAWGSNYSGATTVPAGLSDVIAVAAGSTFSLALTRFGPAEIVQPLAGHTITQGQSVTLNVRVTGDDLAYQWRKDGVDIAGASTGSFTIGQFAPSDAGRYTVVAGNQLGSVTSDPVELSFVGPTFPLQPVQSAQMATAGTEVVFSVAASGSGALSYQWLHNGVPITGATNSALKLEVAGPSDRGPYQVRVSDCAGTATSNAAFLNVFGVFNRVRAWWYRGSGIGMTGAVAIATRGGSSLALKSDGTVVEFGMNPQAPGTPLAGVTGVVAIAVGGGHRLALKSDGTVLVWGDSPSVPTGLNGVVAIAAGGSHSLALRSDGTVVAWGYNKFGQCSVPAGLSGVVAIAAGEWHSLALKADGTVVAWGNNLYSQCDVPSMRTGVVAITAGEHHNLALRSDGTVVGWGYNYYRQCYPPAGLSGVVAVDGGMNHSLALKSDGTVVAWGDNDDGQCDVPPGMSVAAAIAAGDYYSIALEQVFRPKITSQPDRKSFNQGQSVSFSVSSIGGDQKYQWRKDGIDIPGATSASLELPYLTSTNAGVYSVVVSNKLDSVTSDPAPVSLVGPVFPPQPLQSGEVVTAGASVTFSVSAAGSGTLSYQWLHNGLPIAGATESSFTLPKIKYSDQGWYQVKVADSDATVTSSPAFLNVSVPRSSPLLGGDPTISASYQSAVVSGMLNPDGRPTTYFFSYGTADAPGSCRSLSQDVGSGKAPVPFSVAISGLKPGTTYYGHIVAANKSGTTQGAEVSFTTLGAEIDPIAVKGDPAPGLSGLAATFASFGSPIVNDNTEVAFAAAVSGTGIKANGATGIWVRSGTACKLVARAGGAAPLGLIGTGTFKSLNNPVLNNKGCIGFGATLVPDGHLVTAANAAGIWSDLSGTLLPMVRVGDAVPVTGGTAAVGSLSGFVLPDEGGLVFAAKLADKKGVVEACLNEGLWRVDGTGTIKKIICEGDQLDGNKIASLFLLSPPAGVSGQTRSFNNAGDLVFKATFTNHTQGLYVVSSGYGHQIIIRPSDIVARQNDFTGYINAGFTSFNPRP